MAKTRRRKTLTVNLAGLEQLQIGDCRLRFFKAAGSRHRSLEISAPDCVTIAVVKLAPGETKHLSDPKSEPENV